MVEAEGQRRHSLIRKLPHVARVILPALLAVAACLTQEGSESFVVERTASGPSGAPLCSRCGAPVRLRGNVLVAAVPCGLDIPTVVRVVFDEP